MFQSSLDEVLHEVDDLDQEPGEDEIREYAELIGIDVDNEPDLLWIARAGITAALPPDWKPIQVNNGDELYFYNFKTGESSWEHPSDDKYRQMVIEERNKKLQKGKSGENTTSTKSQANKGSAKTVAPTPAAAASATAALKPLKIPASVGKLAPLGGLSNAPQGKLQPINPASAPKTGGKTLAPLSNTAQEPERPKTSRGPQEKEKPGTAPPSQPAVLGGGSRFLKKSDDSSPEKERAKSQNQPNVMQNIMRFPTEDSDSNSESSIESNTPPADAKKVVPVAKNIVLDLDELKPISNPTIVTSAPAVNKPPVAPKAAPPISSTPVAQKEEVKPEPPKQSVISATPASQTSQKVQPSATIPSKPSVQLSPQPSLSENSVNNVQKVEKQLQDEYERQVKQLREQHDQRLKDVRSKFEEEEKKETEKIKKATEDRLKSLKEKLQKDEDTETKQLSASHKKRLDDAKQKLDNEYAQLEKQLQSKNKAMSEEIENVIVRQNSNPRSADFTQDSAMLEIEHKKAMDAAKARFEKELTEDERKHDSEKKRRIDDMRERLQKELDDWYRKEKERKSAMLKNDIDKDLADVRKNLEQEKRSALEEEVSKNFERQRRDLQEKHEKQLLDIRKEHELEIDKVKRKHKEILNDETNVQQRHNERIRGDAFDDLKQRQDEALKSGELQLKAFRDELASLTRMTADIRQTLQSPPMANHVDVAAVDAVPSRTEKHASRKSRRDPVKTAVVKSIDDLLSPEMNGDHSSSRTASSSGQVLDGLETVDVLDKVTRFLESQKSAAAHQRPRSAHVRSTNDQMLASMSTPPITRGTDNAVNGSMANYRSNMDQFADRPSSGYARVQENVFRTQPKDAVDEFVDKKMKEYLRCGATFQSINSQPWISPNSYSYSNRYFNNRRRGFDVESELNSLKRWLNDFENRISNKASSGRMQLPAPKYQERGGLLPIRNDAHHSAIDQAMKSDPIVSLFNDADTVEI